MTSSAMVRTFSVGGVHDGGNRNRCRINVLRRLPEGIVNLSRRYTACHPPRMNTPVPADRCKNHHFPVEIISHSVWLYFRFCLSYRDVEKLLFVRRFIQLQVPVRRGGGAALAEYLHSLGVTGLEPRAAARF